ncbi:hypothetical protein ABT390_13545 [Streptomyces aurantiacus]|uniref:hypothetical protein n=1 Tax=Streptomyces aurantiacus TaxID=47760 RepID=UPI001319C44C|nr:hypothetical protein [Streptomyces aurantiacus]
MVGIIVTVLVSRGSSSADSEPSGGSAPGKQATPSATVSNEDEGAAPKVRYTGGIRIALDSGGGDIDLDSKPPLVGPSNEGSDIFIGANTDGPDIGTEDSSLTMALLPGSGPAPSERECNEKIEKNGIYNTPLARGARLCIQSKEGRTAYLRTVAAPTAGPVQFAVTVWEQPS